MASDAQTRSHSSDVSSRLAGYPLWVLAEVPDISSFLFRFDERTADLLRPRWMLPGLPLSRVEAISSSLEAIVFPPVPPGRRQLGVACFHTDSTRRVDKERKLPLAWALAFQWNASRSAWQALLEAQETLQPQGFSLPPELIVPALFLAHLGMTPLDTNGVYWVERWAPFFVRAQYDLAHLIAAWYHAWIDGPSEAAQRYRQVNNIAAQPRPQADMMITTFDWIFGEKLIQSIRTAGRVEPVLLRGLVLASTQLFDRPTLALSADGPVMFSKQPDWIPPLRKRRRGLVTPPSEQLLRGLLSLASWQMTTLPQEIESKHPQESEELLQAWITWRTSYSHELPAWITDYLIKHLVMNTGERANSN